MKSSRNWTQLEDKTLEHTMLVINADRKLKWEEVAELMHKNIESCQKTGKQCRQRWHNHLAPELNNSSQWTKQQNETLFAKHGELGNKWARIATFLKGRTDNCVKNHFYSTLRRGMRKVNNFIHDQRKQRGSIKEFKPDVLTKILIVADGDPEQKLNAKNNATSLSKTIKQLLIRVSLDTDEETYDAEIIDRVIGLIMEFNKNCKKRKGKKKITTKQIIDQKDQENQEEDEMSQQVSVSKKAESQVSRIRKEKIQQNHIIETFKKEQAIKQKSIQQLPTKQEKTSKENQIINGNQFEQPKEEHIDEQEMKDQVKGIDFSASIVVAKEEGNFQKSKNRLKRALSSQSQYGELFMANTTNFPGANIFSNYSNFKTDAVQPIQSFKSSAIGLSFTLPVDTASKELLADSAIGIRKGEAFNNLSVFSQKNSFLKFEGDRGCVDPQLLQSGELKKTSSIFNNSLVASIEKLGVHGPKS